MTALLFTLAALLVVAAWFAYLSALAYPHIDDVLRELDREDAEKNAAN